MHFNFYFSTKLIFKSFFIFVSILTASTLAQTGTIKSKIFDKITKEPLAGANVVVQGTSLGAAAELDGKFIIRNVPLGKNTLVISYIGYIPITVDIDITATPEEIEYYLEPKTLEGETIVITGQAEGQLSAINQQLSSNTITNIVAKDRIKELPDVNAAETIGRLPGVSIQRSGGEASKIEIRGLSPKYSLITVNGVELPSTSTEDRSIDLSLVSSNMLDGITLKKSNTPDMDADVLGGTVDLRLKEAPQNLQVNLTAQGGYNKLQDYYRNYSFVGSVSNRFLDDRLGVILNANVDNYNRSADKFKDDYVWRNYKIITSRLYFREELIDRDRFGTSLLLDYRLTNGKITANAFFNQLNSDNLIHSNEVFTPQASYNTDRHFYELEQSKKKTNVLTSSIGVEQDLDWFSYNAVISRTGTASDEPDRRVWQFTQEQSGTSGYSLEMSPYEIVKTFNVDTSITNLASLYSYGQRLIENTTTAKLNLEFPFNLGDQLSGLVKTGAKIRWLNRSNDQRQYGYSGLQYGQGSTNPVFNYLNDIFPEWNIDGIIEEHGLLNISPFLKDYSRSDFLNGEFPLGLITNEVMLNQMTDALMNAHDSLNMWAPYSVGTFGYDYKGYERYLAGYIMAELNIGTLITVIPGVRWEEDYSAYDGQRYRVSQSGQTIESPPVEFVRLSKVRKNKFWLPGVHLTIKPLEWLKVTLAGTKTLTRPDFLRYAPISYITANGDQVTAANYSLKPSQATNLDFGVSVYNNEIGLLAVNTFYKVIDDLIFYSNFKSAPKVNPDPSLDVPAGWLAKYPQINAYRNNPDPAKYSGFEIEWQTHFWYLPSVFNGLVLNINYTHIYSEMKLAYDSLVIKQVGTQRFYSIKQTSIKTRMPDQPSHILNLTLGYDWGGFSARVSYLYQTDKLTGIGYEGVNPSSSLSAYTGSYARWDLSIQQKVFENIQVFANFNNLNNRRDQNFVGSSLVLPSYLEYYGFTMDLGIRYNL